MNPTENNTEQHIIEVARQVFIEKGFAETCMSDIAARAGINRPGLHYYFRTKDKMFEAVFADIVLSFIPKIHQIVSQDKPVAERIADIVGVYFNMLQKNPLLPVFVVKEIQRDARHLVNTIVRLETGLYIREIKQELLKEMQRGTIRQTPLEFVLYSFYGLVTVPFLTKPLMDIIIESSEADFGQRLQVWKEQVIRQMIALLCPEDDARRRHDRQCGTAAPQQ